MVGHIFVSQNRRDKGKHP